jgi:hypothetical protein
MKKIRQVFFAFAVLLIAAIFTFSGCDLLLDQVEDLIPGIEDPTNDPDDDVPEPMFTTAWLDAHNWTIGEQFKTTSYSYTAGSKLNIPSGKTLTILPGTTITFTQAGGGISVAAGGTLKAVGLPVMLDIDGNDMLASGNITLKGGSTKGSWDGIEIRSITENKLDYVNIVNAGRGTSAYSCALYLYNGSASLTNSVIDGSASNGITTYSNDGAFTAFEGNIIKNSGKAPIYTESAVWSLRNLSSNNVFTGNTNNYIHAAAVGDITQSMTLKRMSIPYRFDGNFYVNGESVFTVEPGTEIIFGNTNSGIQVAVGAAIVMDGTEESPITLRGAVNTKGAWGDIRIQSIREENKLDYVNIINGGSGTASWNSALYLYNGSVPVTNCIIDGSASNGITIEGTNAYLPVFMNNTINNSGRAPILVYTNIWSLRNISGNNTFAGNTNNYIDVGANGTMPQDMTLTKLSVPYFLGNGLNVSANNVTLTIEPGTQIWVGAGKEIQFGDYSNLVAKGTAEERIVFRGSIDQPGYWMGIQINTNLEGSELAYCDISGGGSGDSWSNNRCLYLYYATLELSNVRISKSLRYGIGLEGTNSIWSEDVSFENCQLGNVWTYYGGAVSENLPTNNFSPITPIL